MMNSIEYYSKYPFTKLAKRLIASELPRIEDLKSDKYREYVIDGYRRVLSALGRDRFKIDPVYSPDKSIFSYFIAYLIVSYINNDLLKKRFADYESKLFWRTLTHESPDIVLKLANEEFNLDVKAIDEEFRWLKIKVNNYLKLTKILRSDQWRLANRRLSRGWVEINMRELKRMLEEAYKSKILEMKEIRSVPDNIREKAERVRLLLRQRTPIKATIKAIPPCIDELMVKLKNGDWLSHEARFTLVAYLLFKGESPDAILKLFSNSPDFDEKKARYQIEHIAGIKTGRKYKVPSCEKIKYWGLCRADETCKGISNPTKYKVMKSEQT